MMKNAGSFTGSTFTVTVWLTSNSPSEAQKVISSVPHQLSSGV